MVKSYSVILTDVISYRTEKGDELKKLAEKQNISLSQLTSNIIDEYLQFHVITQNYDMYRESKEVISLCFELLEKVNVDKVIALHTKGAIQSIKTIIQEYSSTNALVIGWTSSTAMILACTAGNPELAKNGVVRAVARSRAAA